MSLIPLFNDDFWRAPRPARLFDQHFGHGLNQNDVIQPLTYPLAGLSLRTPNYYRPWRTVAAQSESKIKLDKDKFMVTLDVQQFAPEEITVKVTGSNTITVEGKHEEKPDEHGFISRHFVRRYVVPEGHDMGNVASSLSLDGVLSITAPRVAQPDEHRSIPIQQTGIPMKKVQAKKEGKEEN